MRVRPVSPQDRADWDRLYAGYAAFYEVEQTAAMRDRVWGWLMDPAHDVEGLVAEGSGGRLVGLAHLRPYWRPLAASVGGFLDDLFVEPDARGTGAGEALIRAAAERGRERGWTKLRWITAADNARARSLYDRLAVATPWVTYDMDLAP
jgi:GNAT superfamily N-acetyltransferase